MKRWINYIAFSAVVIAILVEICTRTVLDYLHALLVINIELLALGVSLCITTIIYVRLQRSIFE